MMSGLGLMNCTTKTAISLMTIKRFDELNCWNGNTLTQVCVCVLVLHFTNIKCTQKKMEIGVT